MNIDVVKKYLLGIPNVETAESAHSGNRIFTFRLQAPNGKAYSTKIEVTNDDDVSIQCDLVLGHAVDTGLVGRCASALNAEFHQKRWGITFLVEDGCVIASTGTSGEVFSQGEISKRLMLLLKSISELDDRLNGDAA